MFDKPLRAAAIGCFAFAIVLYLLENRFALGLAGLGFLLEIIGYFIPNDTKSRNH